MLPGELLKMFRIVCSFVITFDQETLSLTVISDYSALLLGTNMQCDLDVRYMVHCVEAGKPDTTAFQNFTIDITNPSADSPMRI